MHSLLNKDPLNTFQQRLQRFATLDNQGGNSPQTDDAKRSSSKQTGQIKELSATPGGKQEIWSGTYDLKAPIPQAMTSARNKPLSKPLSPQLNKGPSDLGFLRENHLPTENSYIKKVKQALLEKVGQPEKLSADLKFSPKTKENLEMLNLKKLRNITNGHNMFLNNAQLTSNFGLDQNYPEKLNKSSNGNIGAKRQPLGEKDINIGKTLNLFSNEVLRTRPNDSDISRSSINSREKSASVSRSPALRQAVTATPQSAAEAEGDELPQRQEDDTLADKLLDVVPEAFKAARLKMLSQLEDTVFQIYNLISQDLDPYETIRTYSDLAQDVQFNYLEQMLKHDSSRFLYSRLLKLERWLIVYLFYFTIQDSDHDKFKLLMLEVSDLLYKNLSFLVSWTVRIMESQEVSPSALFKSVSVQVSVAQLKSVRFVVAAQQHVKASLDKLAMIAASISKEAEDCLKVFCNQIDKLSANKAFEKAFESFYKAFISKGVISVSFPDKENNSPAGRQGSSDLNAQSQPRNTDKNIKETPKKAQAMLRRIEDTPAERKSFGDKLIIQELRDMDGIHMGSVYIDKIDSPCFLFQPDTHKVKQKRPLLPGIRADRQYTLVLDLDETLIHFEENADGTSQFLIRPYAQNFLKEVSKYYELVIFTAALKDYADFILDRLDTEQLITHRLYRSNCSFSENVYQKDLSKLGRDLSRTLIVDNNAENFQQQPDNGIYIKSWYNDANDEALKKLAPLLIGRPC